MFIYNDAIFFLFASISASFALVVRLIAYKESSLTMNLLTLVVFCLSDWVSIDGAVFHHYVVFIPVCIAQNHRLLALCLYTPEYSPLWFPFVYPLRIYLSQAVFGILSLLVAIYMITPLFMHLVKQIWSVAKLYGRKYVNLRVWRF